jgi:ABC-type transport system involved in cytochrome c biogenesis permease subunit
MAQSLHQLSAAAYLVAALLAVLGLGLAGARFSRAAVGVLGGGLALQTAALLALHGLDPTPPLTELPLAVSLMGWIGTAAYLLLLLRVRGAGLVVLVAPLAFVGVVFASVAPPPAPVAPAAASPFWSHLHVLLASAGLALLGLAGAAGVLYVVHHRAIKAKRPGPLRVPLPSLESLDRVNALALGAGFLLLTLGLLSGVAWVQVSEGRLWPGGLHANATALAWALYAALVAARFVAPLGARQSALSSAAGFAVLLAAVVGLGLVS